MFELSHTMFSVTNVKAKKKRIKVNVILKKDDMRIYKVKDDRPPLSYHPPYNPKLPEFTRDIVIYHMKCKSGKTNFVANYLNTLE